jgi:hypothetical protein
VTTHTVIGACVDKTVISVTKVRQDTDIISTFLKFFLQVLFVIQGIVNSIHWDCHEIVNKVVFEKIHRKTEVLEQEFPNFASCSKN